MVLKMQKFPSRGNQDKNWLPKMESGCITMLTRCLCIGMLPGNFRHLLFSTASWMPSYTALRCATVVQNLSPP